MIKSENYEISQDHPSYFIADIAANHDGSLNRALELLELCAESGASAAKFQHFRAETIVSDLGFRSLGGKLTHQKSWKESVYDVYKKAELSLEWTDTLVSKCKALQIDFFSAVYDLELIDLLAKQMPFFKIGSGDINWIQAIDKMISFKKPIFLATGASSITEVKETVNSILAANVPLVLMQCNTNYTSSEYNIHFLNLNVLDEYKKLFPEVILGLSDHTQDMSVVVAAVAKGARVIERHFTDDITRPGPDHKFSLNPTMWRNMVDSIRTLERCLGDGQKKIEENEIDARIVQRRSIRAARPIKRGELIQESDLVCLRPCPKEGLPPSAMKELIGSEAKSNIGTHDLIPSDWLRKSDS